MKAIKTIMDVPIEELVAGGAPLCSGCPAALGLKLALKALGRRTIVINASGCMTLFTTFPHMPTRVPWLHVAIENAAAVATGIRAALEQLGRNRGVNILCFAGDGATYDIGFQALSGAVARRDDFIFVCLPRNEEIILGNGEVVKIGEYIEKEIKDFDNTHTIESNNQLLNIKNKINESLVSVPVNGSVISWNGNIFKPSNIVAAQRIESPAHLIKITTRSGSTLSLTPEHNVLVDSLGGFVWRRADELNEEDRLISPRRININNDICTDIIGFISDDINAILPREFKETIKERIRDSFGSVRNGCKELSIPEHRIIKYALPVPLGILRKLMEYGLVNREEFASIDKFNTKGAACTRIEQKEISNKHFYLLGLIASDGYIKKRHGIAFTNTEKRLIEKFKRIYKELFPENNVTEIKIDNVYHVHVSNPILHEIASYLNIKEDPCGVVRFKEDHISNYMRGVFDGDGCAALSKVNNTTIPLLIITTVKETLAKRYKLLLQRIGIASSLIKRKNRYDIHISSRLDVQRFIRLVGSCHPKKKHRMNKMSIIMDDLEEKGKHFSLAPMITGKILKGLCQANGIPVKSIDTNLFNIANCGCGISKTKTKRLLSKLEKHGIYSNILKKAISDEFHIDPVKNIEKIESKHKYVYDITVKGTHNFVPEGHFVISNCYNNHSFSNTGVQMSSATPYGAYTTTTPLSRAGSANILMRKPMAKIIAAHGAPYVAQACVSDALDYMRKLQKAASIPGPKFIDLLAPCPTGWGFDSSKTIEVGDLAIRTGAWPLYEIERGKFTLNYKPAKLLPVREYLKAQRRFRGISDRVVRDIQGFIDSQWKLLLQGKYWEAQEY